MVNPWKFSQRNVLTVRCRLLKYLYSSVFSHSRVLLLIPAVIFYQGLFKQLSLSFYITLIILEPCRYTFCLTFNLPMELFEKTKVTLLKCDQMAILFVQYFTLLQNKNLSNGKNILKDRFKILPITK